mmetsp:Transcript_49952/g.116998  ORF Transcript_49952/g.116998 Transcript_49952/m.116998 type:complete len:454 (-) Transcript_49952:158-1519(-)
MVDKGIVVLDNGGHTCKAGFAGEAEPKRIVPNLIARSKAERKTYVGDQFDSCADFSGLQYKLSLEKGYPVNWETQVDVWTRIFGKDVLAVNTPDCRLMLSMPPLCPSAIQATVDEMAFEHFGFKSVCTMCPQLLAHYAQQAEFEARNEPLPPATLVVDCGFSSTSIVPIYDAQQLNFGVRRLSVGGKLLTNHVKQVISHRQWNVMDESHMLNDVKEQMCYVSIDLAADLRAAARRKPNAITREFVMPDYISVTRGYVKPVDVDPPPACAPPAGSGAAGVSAAERAAGLPLAAKKAKGKEGGKGKESGPAARGGGGRGAGDDEQVLALGVERFATGEVLFRPADIGLDEAGVPEAVVQAVGATLPDLHEALYSNILLVGGTTRLPNFGARLEAELRQLVPADYALNVRPAPDPIVAAWKGASLFAAGPLFERSSVSREEYLEHGHSFVRRVCHN